MIVRSEILETRILIERSIMIIGIEGICADHISDVQRRCYGEFGLLKYNESSRAKGN